MPCGDKSGHLNNLFKTHFHQVLSESVALALDKQNLKSTTATREYIRKIDRFFDCLNGWSLFIGNRRNKPDLSPYWVVTDRRFRVNIRNKIEVHLFL